MSQDYNPGDYNQGGMIAFMFSMVVTMVFFVYVGFVHKGVDLKEIPQPDKIEKEQPKAEGAAEEGKADQAWNSTPESIHQGQQVFFSQCQSCHGAKGRGDGPQSKGLKVPPRDLVQGNWLRGGDSVSLYNTITKGLGLGSPMMSYHFLSVSDRWALVHYVRSITNNKVSDDRGKLRQFALKTIKD